MTYIDSNLIDGEVVAYRTRLHWTIFGTRPTNRVRRRRHDRLQPRA